MKVKIELDKNQTREEAEELLYKALDSHRKGAQHGEEFQDPVMAELYSEMKANYGEIYYSMLDQINALIDKEVS